MEKKTAIFIYRVKRIEKIVKNKKSSLESNSNLIIYIYPDIEE